MNSFVIAQLKDIEVVAFIIQMQTLLDNKKVFKMLPHVTLRGPYKETISSEILEKVKQNIPSPIVIEGSDFFDNPQGFVVYFNTNIKTKKENWWKPTYPKNKYGANPHVTIYKGKNKILTENIVKYFNSSGFKIKCYDCEIKIHRSSGQQLSLFNENSKFIEECLKFKLNKYYKDILNDIKDLLYN